MQVGKEKSAKQAIADKKPAAEPLMSYGGLAAAVKPRVLMCADSKDFLKDPNMVRNGNEGRNLFGIAPDLKNEGKATKFSASRQNKKDLTL